MSPLLLLALDLSVSDGGLIEGGQTGQWGWADPAAGPVGLGSCWGTNPDGRYLHDTIDTLEIPVGDLTGVTRPILTVRHWYEIAAGDLGVLELDDGTGWSVAEPVFGYPDPAGFVGTSAGYVVHAWDLSGQGATPGVRLRLQSNPSVALDGWYVQEINLWDGDVVPPKLSPLIVPGDTQDLGGPYPVEIEIFDDVGVQGATLSWSTDESGPFEVPMVSVGADTWHAEIPGQAPDTIVRWSVLAGDGSQQARWPAVGEEAFRVFLAAPTELQGPPAAHAVAQRVELSWTPPDSPHTVSGYELTQEGQGPSVVVSGTAASVVLTPDVPQRFEVRALYDVGAGDPSEPLELDVEVPELLELDPSFAYQGERRYVQLSGRSLYLLQGETVLALGPGITVLSLDVRDAHAATALIEIGADAAVGPRSVELDSTVGPLSFGDRFELRSGDDAPRILWIEPGSLEQGEEIAVEIEATTSFATTPTITGGEDLVITGAVQIEGPVVRFGLAASTRARLGTHTLVIDDGARRFLVGIEVEEYVVPPARQCATAPPRLAPGGLLIGLVGLLRRREKPRRGDRRTGG